MRNVEAHDLELYAINTGAFYKKHVAMIGGTGFVALARWEAHIKHIVIPHYSREIEPVTALDSTIAEVAFALAEYYDRHRKEMT